MEKPIVTINLDRYNELLKIEKNYNDEFKTFVIQKRSAILFGWSDEKSVYVETNSDGIKKLCESFEKKISSQNTEMERYKLFEYKNEEQRVRISKYNSKSIWYRIFHKV